MSCTETQMNMASNNKTNSGSKKRVYTPALGVKKLLKSVRRIFKKASIAATYTPAQLLHYCLSEEEHQNWQNELAELAANAAH